jgi:hypothetical protein
VSTTALNLTNEPGGTSKIEPLGVAGEVEEDVDEGASSGVQGRAGGAWEDRMEGKEQAAS